jgi:L-asparaginase
MKNANSQENLTILLLGTGGTIAGLLKKSDEVMSSVTYQSALLPVEALIPKSRQVIMTEQIAQIDSKDMSFEVWERLYLRISQAQSDPAIHAIVMTHGTDTMEETAYFLHRTLVCTKPVILTGAMRPADAADSDGPANMSFAMEQAEYLSAGVWVAFAGRVLGGGNVQKVHPTRLDAFDVIDDDSVPNAPVAAFHAPVQRWPRIEVVMSYAGTSGEVVEALIAQRVDGIVVAGTGNATVHYALETLLDKARKTGVVVELTTRCLPGRVVQAKIDLMLALMKSA